MLYDHPGGRGRGTSIVRANWVYTLPVGAARHGAGSRAEERKPATRATRDALDLDESPAWIKQIRVQTQNPWQ